MVWENFVLWSSSFIYQFSYAAIFILSFIGTSTILIPFPIYLIIFFASGMGLNPILVGIVSGLGSGFGELTGYLVGAGSRSLMEEKKVKKRWRKIEKLFKALFNSYGFLVIVIAAFLPFPFDFVGVLSGVGKYDIKKFILATSIGKVSKCLIIAYAGYFTLPYLWSWA